jgi:hypothetical protein
MIPICKDPALTMLKSKGYNVVRLPKADLLPTQLLVRKGKSLQRLGDLTSVFIPDPPMPPPSISADNPGPSIAGTKSADLNIGIGLNILGGLIASLGGSTLGLSTTYSRARSVQFEFAETRENNSQIALIDPFLAAAQVNPFARAVADMLEADDVFVITSTLKATKINVKAKAADKTDLKLDVPVVQQAVGGNLKVSAGGNSDSTLTYEGNVPLVFGFQAVRLIFDQGQYRTMKLTDAGSITLESAALAHNAEAENYVWLSEDRLIAGDL